MRRGVGGIGGFGLGLGAGLLFPFIANAFRPRYRPVVPPQQIQQTVVVQKETTPANVPKDVDLNETQLTEVLEDFLIKRLAESDEVGEVALAFGDVDSIVDRIFDEMVNQAQTQAAITSQVFRDTTHWTSYNDGKQTFIILSEAEFNMEELKASIDGNPTFDVKQHNGNVSDEQLLDFISNNRVPPENILVFT